MSSLRTLAISAILHLAVLTAGSSNPSSSSSSSFNLGDGQLGGNDDDACRDAFSVDVTCGPELGDFMRTRSMHREGSRLPTENELDSFCTDSCLVSLLQYRQSVRRRCGDAVYEGEGGHGRRQRWKPLQRAESAVFAYKRTCLKNPSVKHTHTRCLPYPN